LPLRARHLRALVLGAALGCSSSGADETTVAPESCEAHDAQGNVVVRCPVAWRDRTVELTGSLTVEPGGELLLERTTLDFAPRIEDTDTAIVRGKLVARQSRLASKTGRQWNLQAFDGAVLDWEGTTATDHSGIRLFGKTRFVAKGGDVEEVQLHDDAAITLDGAAAYVVLFFVGDASAELVGDQALAVGPDLTRSYSLPNGSGTGTLTLAGADVVGWQIDLEGSAEVRVADAGDVVLAIHVEDAVFDQAGASITSAAPADGAVDFGPGRPRFVFESSVVSSLNLYAEGACALSFAGPLHVTEPSVGGTSKLGFGAAVTLEANLAMTFDQGEMTLDGTKLVDDAEGGLYPSFTAADGSRIHLVGVDATAHARAATVGAGRIVIEGGSGWTADKLEEIDKEAGGGITVQ
jgi:hypothetical protein